MITGVLLFGYSTLMLEALDLFFAKEMLVDPVPFWDCLRADSRSRT
jgi:hypothetical protein